MKKIIFCLQTMVCGGVEKELITILKRFDSMKYDITVLVLYIEDHKIISELPSNVHLYNLGLDKNYYCSSTANMVRERIKKGKIKEAVSLAVKRVLKIGVSEANMSLDGCPSPKETFDIAVCYHIHSPFMFRFVGTSITANKKIAWIHSDFRTTKYPIDRMMDYACLYDTFVAVSCKVAEEFKDLCPKYSNKISVVHNIIDGEEILRKAEMVPQNDEYFKYSGTKILTVGRFSKEKGIDRAILVCNLLKNTYHLDFRWYLVGWGDEELLYRELIKKYGLENDFIILGRKDNPYPYIASCDIYCQTSISEAYSMTILEAMQLCRPIICTDFDGADEQVKNGETGIIVPNNDLMLLCDKLKNMINDSLLREKLSNNLKTDSGFENDWKKIISFF